MTTTLDLLSTEDAAAEIGVTYRVLDYWSRNAVLRASGSEATGSGSRRRWTPDDVRVGRVLAVLADLGATRSALALVSFALGERVRRGQSLTGRIVVDRSGLLREDGHGWIVDLDRV